jgi:hypothetical protein
VIDNAFLNETIDATMASITRAGRALITFFDDTRVAFVRDSVAQDEDGRPSIGRTSTCRALTGLIDLARVLTEEEATDPELHLSTIEIINLLAKEYFTCLVENPDELRTSDINGVNMFTDSHLVLSALMLDAYRTAGADREPRGGRINLPPERFGAGMAEVERIAEQIQQNLVAWLGGRIHQGAQTHDFITLYGVRAADALQWRVGRIVPNWPPDLSERVGNSILQQLGYHSADIASRFDPAELVFSTCLLRRLAVPHGSQLTRRVLDIIAKTQTNDGAWPTAKMISHGPRQLLHVASYEVALALADLLLDQIERDPAAMNQELIPLLNRSYGLIRSTRADVGAWQGWGNDRALWPPLIESWTTAVVLSFLVRYRQALLRIQQYQILSKYEVIPAAPGRISLPWTDLRPILDPPIDSEFRELERAADPTPDRSVVQAVGTRLIEPVKRTWIARPASASVLLLGPSGTRKVSLIEAMARDLGWPLLTLSPPDFLNPSGLAGFEVRAAEVCSDLMQLRRVVVLFDECDDFFRARFRAGAPIGLPTIGAFVTAGVLPRLRAVRSNRWVILAVATNCRREELDPAVLERGVFDYQQDIALPALPAQILYIELHLGTDSEEAGLLAEALTQFERHNFNHDSTDMQEGGAVSFALLDDLLAALSAGRVPADVNVLVQEIANLTARSGPAYLA